MILIWRGKGLLVLLFALGGAALGAGLQQIFNPNGMDLLSYMGIGMMLCGAVCTKVGMSLLRKHEDGERHDLYFIPVVAWGPVICIIGLCLMLNASGGQWHEVDSSNASRRISSNASTPADAEEAKRILDSILVQKNVTPTKAVDTHTVDVPDGFVFRPAFELEDETVEAGTAFAVEMPGEKRVLILSALHLLGPSGGAKKDVPPGDVPRMVKALTLGDVFSEDVFFEGSAAGLSIFETAPLGERSKAGDVIGFWIEANERIKPKKLATRIPSYGERVYLVGQVLNEGKEQVRFHGATVRSRDKDGDLTYVFDLPGLQIRATSGAPVVNQQGEVVAINLGGGEMQVNGLPSDRVYGVGNPVTKFNTNLLAAIRREKASRSIPPIRPIVESVVPPVASNLPETPAVQGPVVPKAAAKSPKHFQTQSKMRMLASRLQSVAIRQRDLYPQTLEEAKNPATRAEDLLDAWGEGYLYFGAGKKRQPFDRTKTLLLATSQARDGWRVVVYLNGNAEMVSEEAFAEMVKE